jgi:predicted O-methyltransferase YrrM
MLNQIWTETEPMPQSPLQTLLSELAYFGKQNDQSISDRSRKMLNITPDTGEFLSVLVKAMAARRILEIGTSNGYSTLWLADAARTMGGHVKTVEQSDYKISLARENFRRANLEPYIELIQDDAGHVLANSTNESFDFIFLDSDRTEYMGWWPHLKRMLRSGGLLVADNATSHAEQMLPLMAMIRQDESFTTSLIPIGNGEFLAVKSGS